MKVGIFGGTFDPIHSGHLIIAEEAREGLGLDEVVFIPAGQPWLKAGQQISDARHRMAMVQLATASNSRFRASDVEIKRQGPTYTVDTLAELCGELGPTAELYLILGIDLLAELARWHEPVRLFELATVVAMSRQGFKEFDMGVLDAIAPGTSTRVVLMDGPMIGISGADLRRRVAAGLSIRYQVPDGVAAYIQEYGLYKS